MLCIRPFIKAGSSPSNFCREVGVTANAGSDNLEGMALKTLSPAQVRNRPQKLGVGNDIRKVDQGLSNLMIYKILVAMCQYESVFKRL